MSLIELSQFKFRKNLTGRDLFLNHLRECQVSILSCLYITLANVQQNQQKEQEFKKVQFEQHQSREYEQPQQREYEQPQQREHQKPQSDYEVQEYQSRVDKANEVAQQHANRSSHSKERSQDQHYDYMRNRLGGADSKSATFIGNRRNPYLNTSANVHNHSNLEHVSVEVMTPTSHQVAQNMKIGSSEGRYRSVRQPYPSIDQNEDVQASYPQSYDAFGYSIPKEQIYHR